MAGGRMVATIVNIIAQSIIIGNRTAAVTENMAIITTMNPKTFVRRPRETEEHSQWRLKVDESYENVVEKSNSYWSSKSSLLNLATSDHYLIDQVTMSSFNDKVIAITGATGGIGLAVAKLLASRGATLSLADLDQSAVDSLVSSLGSSGCKCFGVAVDVRQSSQVDAWIAKTVEKFGRLDGAANLAGVIGNTDFKGVGDMDDKNWDLIIGVNLTGVMYSLRAEIRAFGQGKGSVVNAASIAGLLGRPGIAAYSTSKHGVIGLTRSAAKEYGRQGIRVNAICPGPIETPMLDQIMGTTATNKEGVTNTYNTLPLGRKGHADEVAAAVAYLLGDDSSYVTGVAFPVLRPEEVEAAAAAAAVEQNEKVVVEEEQDEMVEQVVAEQDEEVVEAVEVVTEQGEKVVEVVAEQGERVEEVVEQDEKVEEVEQDENMMEEVVEQSEKAEEPGAEAEGEKWAVALQVEDEDEKKMGAAWVGEERKELNGIPWTEEDYYSTLQAEQSQPENNSRLSGGKLSLKEK
ncbi:MAG: hypothetical protein Q9165_007722 [Trypethelium subeluteriae]